MKNLAVTAAIVLAAAAIPAVVLTSPAHAFTVAACHDDTSVSRSNTHGSPLNGTFGTPGAGLNHQNAYYYLDVQSSSACPAGSDGHVHLLLQVTANGTGLKAGHPACDTSAWFPSSSHPCLPVWRGVSGAGMTGERPTWGFEFKDASTGKIVACTGGNGSGGTNCPGTPDVTADPGNATVTFRFDRAVAGRAYRARIANQYDDVIWESARLDVVACSTCFPAAAP